MLPEVAGAARGEEAGVMGKPMRGSVSFVLVAGMTLTAGPTAAAVTGALPRVHAAAPLLVSRNTRVPLMRLRPELLTNAFRTSRAPVLGLPPLQPLRFKALPLLQPLEAAALTSAGFDDCGRSRPGVLIAMLPAAPFAPLACTKPTRAAYGGDRQTSLVPGRKKDALYGRAYSPHDLDAP